MSIKHLVSYIARGTLSEALQKLPEMTPSNLKTERRWQYVRFLDCNILDDNIDTHPIFLLIII